MPPELFRRLRSQGFKKKNVPALLVYTAPVNRDNWAFAYRIKAEVEAELGPKIDPKLIEEFSGANDGERSAKAGEVDLNRRGVDPAAILNDQDNVSVGVFRDILARLLPEMGILDLYPIPQAESSFNGEGHPFGLRRLPLSIDGEGRVQGKGEDQLIEHEMASKVIAAYLPGKGIPDLLRRVLALIEKSQPLTPLNILGGKKIVRKVIDRAIKRLEGSDPRVIDKLLDLRAAPGEEPKQEWGNFLQIRSLAELARQIAGWNRQRIALREIEWALDQISEKVQALGRDALPEELLRALTYLEGRLLAVYNRTIHRAPSAKVELRFDTRRVDKIKMLRFKKPDRPEGLGYTVAPPKVAGEFYPVSYGSGEFPPGSNGFFQFEGPWKELLGMPPIGFSALLSGPPKQGKSTLALGLAAWLARRGHGPVLYASFEEAHNPSLTEKRERLGIENDRIDYKNYLPLDLSPWPAVIVDSLTKARMGMETITELLTRYPATTFVFISQVTKAGKVKGSNEIPHEVDVLIEVKDGQASANGRFGSGTMPVVFEAQ